MDEWTIITFNWLNNPVVLQLVGEVSEYKTIVCDGEFPGSNAVYKTFLVL